MISLRARLSGALLLISGALLLVGGFSIRATVRSSLRAEFDQALESKAMALVTLTKEEQDEIELDFTDQFMPEFEDLENPWFFQLWLPDGAILERSRSVERFDTEQQPVALARAELRLAPRFTDVLLPDKRPGRQVQIDFVPQDEDEDTGEEQEDEPTSTSDGSMDSARMVTLVTARERASLDQKLRALDRRLGLLGLLLLLGLVIVTYLGMPYLLRPLRRMEREFYELDAESLDRRLEEQGVPIELQGVVGRANQLLERLERAFARERRLSANLAHELRTPIAELQTLAEVGQRWPDDRETALQFFTDVREISEQMGALVSGLLALARLESGVDVPRSEIVSLREHANAVCSGLREKAADRQITFAVDVPGDVAFRTDQWHFEVVLRNLIENAVTYSPPGSTVEMSADRDRARVAFLVHNPAPDLQPSDLEHLCERFWRKSESRTERGHSGLGLALVKELCRKLALGFEARLDGDRLVIQVEQELRDQAAP